MKRKTYPKKICIACNKLRSINLFPTNMRYKDGLSNKCYMCSGYTKTLEYQHCGSIFVGAKFAGWERPTKKRSK